MNVPDESKEVFSDYVKVTMVQEMLPAAVSPVLRGNNFFAVNLICPR